MPTISVFYGITIMMFFSDHNPPHFHVKYGDYEAIIYIVDGEVDGKMPRRVLNMVFEWLDLHKDELMENWRLMELSKPLVSINPLK